MSEKAIEKRYERSQDKAKFDEKAEFIFINEHFKPDFNAVLTSAIVFQHPAINGVGGFHMQGI